MASSSRKSMPTKMPSQGGKSAEKGGEMLGKLRRATTTVKMSNAMKKSTSIGSMLGSEKKTLQRASTGTLPMSKHEEEESKEAAFRKIVGTRQIYSIAKNFLNDSSPTGSDGDKENQEGSTPRRVSFERVGRAVQLGAKTARLKNTCVDVFMSVGCEKYVHDKLGEMLKICMQNHIWIKLQKGLEELDEEMDKFSNKHGDRVDFTTEKVQVSKALVSIKSQQAATEQFTKCLNEIKALEEELDSQPEVMWAKLMESRDLVDQSSEAAEELQKAVQLLGKISSGKKNAVKALLEEDDSKPLDPEEEKVTELFSHIEPETLYEIRDGLVTNGLHDQSIEEDVREKFSTLGASPEDLNSVLDTLRAEAWGESVQQAVKSILALSEVSMLELCKTAETAQEKLERDHADSKPEGFRSIRRRTMPNIKQRSSIFRASERRKSTFEKRRLSTEGPIQEPPQEPTQEQASSIQKKKPPVRAAKRVSIFEEIDTQKREEEKGRERRLSQHLLEEEARNSNRNASRGAPQNSADQAAERRRSLFKHRISMSERRESLSARRESMAQKRKSIIAQMQAEAELEALGEDRPPNNSEQAAECPKIAEEEDSAAAFHAEMRRMSEELEAGPAKEDASETSAQSDPPSDDEGDEVQRQVTVEPSALPPELPPDLSPVSPPSLPQSEPQSEPQSPQSEAKQYGHSAMALFLQSLDADDSRRPPPPPPETGKKTLRSLSMVEDVTHKLGLRQCLPTDTGELLQGRIDGHRKDRNKSAFDPQNVGASLLDKIEGTGVQPRRHATVDSERTLLFNLNDVPGLEVLMRGEGVVVQRLGGRASSWKRVTHSGEKPLDLGEIRGTSIAPTSPSGSSATSFFSESEFLDEADADPSSLFPESADQFQKRQILMMHRMRKAFSKFGEVKDVYIAEAPELPQRVLAVAGQGLVEKKDKPEKKSYTGFVTFHDNSSAKTALGADLSDLRIAGKGVVTVKKLEADAVATWQEVAVSNSLNASAALTAAIYPEEEATYKLLLAGRLSSALVELSACIVSKWGSIEAAAKALSRCGGEVGGNGRIGVETLHKILKTEKGYKRSLAEVCTLFQAVEVVCSEAGTLSVAEFSRLGDIKRWLDLEEQHCLLADELFGILQLRRILMEVMSHSEIRLAQVHSSMLDVLRTCDGPPAEARESVHFLKRSFKECHAALESKREDKFAEVLLTRRGLQIFVEFLTSSKPSIDTQLVAISILASAVDAYIADGTTVPSSGRASPGLNLASEREIFLAAELWRPLLSIIDPEAAEDTFGVSADDAPPIDSMLLRSLMSLFLRAGVPSAVVGANAHVLAPHVSTSLRRLQSAASEEGATLLNLLQAIELLEQSHEAIDSSLAGTVSQVHRMAAALGGCQILGQRLSAMPRGEDVEAEKLGKRMLKAWEQERARLFLRWPLPGEVKASELARVDLLEKVVHYAHEEEFWTEWPSLADEDTSESDEDESGKLKPEKKKPGKSRSKKAKARSNQQESPARPSKDAKQAASEDKEGDPEILHEVLARLNNRSEKVRSSVTELQKRRERTASAKGDLTPAESNDITQRLPPLKGVFGAARSGDMGPASAREIRRSEALLPAGSQSARGSGSPALSLHTSAKWAVRDHLPVRYNLFSPRRRQNRAGSGVSSRADTLSRATQVDVELASSSSREQSPYPCGVKLPAIAAALGMT